MTEPPTKSKLRALSGAMDQVFSSLSNGLIIYAIAVVASVGDFGRIALLMTLLAAAIGVLRGSLGTPLLLSSARSVEDVRREGSFAATTALVVAPIVGISMILVSDAAIRPELFLLLAATPVVLVQDVLRYVAIAEGRAHIAAIWDGVWFVGSLLLLVATWDKLRFVDAAVLIGGWGLLALVALIGMLFSLRVFPRLRGYREWLAVALKDRIRYGTEAGLEQVTVFVVLLSVTLMLAPAVTAALRGATALLAPVAILASATPLIVISEGARLTMSPQQVWRILLRIALGMSVFALVIGIGLSLMPLWVGELVLGATFSATQQIVPIIAFEYAVGCAVTAVAIYLRTFNRSRDALMLKVGYVAVTLVASLGMAATLRTASGAALGMAFASTFVAAMSLLWFRPWAAPDEPRAVGLQRPPTGRHRALALAPAGATQHVVPLVIRARLAAQDRIIDALIMAWSAAVLLVFGPIAIIRFTSIPENNLWLWALPGLILSGARLAWLIGNGERRLFEMMYWSFAYAFLGLAPLVQLRLDAFPVTVARMDWTLVGAGSMIVIIGCSAFLLGCLADNALALRTKKFAADVRHAARRSFTVDHTRLVATAVFAILFNIYYLSKVGWIQFLMSRDEAFASYDVVWRPGSLGVMVRAFTFMSLLVSFVALVRYRREAKQAAAWGEVIGKRTLRINMILLWVVGILLANSMNPISNARYLSGTAILAASTALGLFATRKRYRVMVVSFLLGLLVVFPLADAFRYGTEANFKASNPVEALISPDYDSFGQLMNGYLVGERVGIIPGRQFLGVILFWVPRAMWPNKPEDTGIYIANVRGYPFTNLSSPLWIEMYLNGGWIVLILVMFGLGWWLHRVDSRMDRQFATVGMPGLLGCILPFYMMILLRGSLLQAASYLFFILVFTIAVRKAKPRIRDGDSDGTGTSLSTREEVDPPRHRELCDV